MTSTEIALRHVVRFGPYRNLVEMPLAVPLPKNSLDPRYAACVDHRTACDCREAGFAEERAEYRAELDEVRRAFEEMLTGHATWVESADGRWDERLQCKCTGCQIARRLHFGFGNSVVITQQTGPRRPLPLFPDGSEVPF